MKKILVAGVVVAVLVAAYVMRMGDRDERRIRKRLAELVVATEFTEREDMLKAGVRSRIIGGFFVPDLSVDVSGLPMNISSRADLVTLMFNLRTRMDGLNLALEDVEVEVAPDRSQAQLVVNARAQAEGMGQEETLYKHVEVDWRKTDEDGWRIAAMRSVELFEQR